MRRLLIGLFGAAADLAGLGSFLLFMLFVLGLGLPRSLDARPPATATAALLVDVGLIALFGIQHSMMARCSDGAPGGLPRLDASRRLLAASGRARGSTAQGGAIEAKRKEDRCVTRAARSVPSPARAACGPACRVLRQSLVSRINRAAPGVL